MNPLFEEIEKVIDLYGDRKIIIYGVGAIGNCYCSALAAYGVSVNYFVDMDRNKQGQTYKGVMIKSPYDILYEEKGKFVILIAITEKEQIKVFLEGLGFVDKIDFYDLGNICRGKATDKFDAFLGYTRDDDIEGFKIYGEDNAEKRILVLGGSTTDFSTSGIKPWSEFLYEKLKEKGCSIQLFNGGMSGYYSSQELLKLIRDGLYLKPDMVISYSGVNDSPNIKEEKFSLTSAYLKNTLNNLTDNNARYGFEKKLNHFETWINNERMMNVICKEFGIKFFTFLQPIAYIGKPILNEKEKTYIKIKYGETYVNNCLLFYEKAIREIEKYDYITNFTDIFDGISDIYYDQCHCTEKGNKIIAEKIYEEIKKEL